jgi:hypothetical protein
MEVKNKKEGRSPGTLQPSILREFEAIIHSDWLLVEGRCKGRPGNSPMLHVCHCIAQSEADEEDLV